MFRKTAEITSAPPATARNTSASPRLLPTSPNATIDTPHTVTATMMARPGRRTRPIQPELAAPTNAPKAAAANSRPTTSLPRWNCVSESTGKSTRGMPKTIATMSIVNVDWSTRRPRRYRRPLRTAASPTSSSSTSAGIGRCDWIK